MVSSVQASSLASKPYSSPDAEWRVGCIGASQPSNPFLIFWSWKRSETTKVLATTPAVSSCFVWDLGEIILQKQRDSWFQMSMTAYHYNCNILQYSLFNISWFLYVSISYNYMIYYDVHMFYYVNICSIGVFPIFNPLCLCAFPDRQYAAAPRLPPTTKGQMHLRRGLIMPLGDPKQCGGEENVW